MQGFVFQSEQMVYTGKIRELLEESILIRVTVKIPSDMRRLIITEGNIKKSI